MVKKVCGEFSFCILSVTKENSYSAYICRDRIGVRPLFIGKNNNNENIGICSEAKGLISLFDKIEVFKPGTFTLFRNDHYVDNSIYTVSNPYYDYKYKISHLYHTYSQLTLLLYINYYYELLF